MDFERAPATECTSRIDGKLIRVRHAVEGDFLSIRNMLRELGAGHEAQDFERCVVAEQEGKLLGFGVVADMGKGISRLEIHVDERHKYLSELIARHLTAYSQK